MKSRERPASPGRPARRHLRTERRTVDGGHPRSRQSAQFAPAVDEHHARRGLTAQIIETIPMRVFWKDRSSHYLGCNAAFARDAGVDSPEALLGKDDYQLGWRNQAGLYQADDRRVMESRAPKLSYDEPQTTPSGDLIWLRTSKVPLRDHADNVIGVLGVYEDITGWKLTELALQESEQRFRLTFQNSAIGMAMVSTEGRWLKVNDALCQILGYSESELQAASFQDITHPDDLPVDLDRVHRMLKGELAHEQVEKRFLHKDGHVVWTRLSLSLVRKDNGVPLHFVSQIQDITEDRLLAERVRVLNEELERKVLERTRELREAQDELLRKEKLAVLGQVAGSVGHELRNPLGVMNNAVYYLQTVLEDADDVTREYLGIIKDEIAVADRIVGDLLDSVRTKPPHAERVVIQESLDRALASCAVPAAVTLRMSVPSDCAPLTVDRLQLHQVLRNLIGNAVDAMPNGGALTVAVDQDPDASITTIRVQDTGEGIPPEHLARLFQPLFTTKARGIGLGLVVVRNLTQANGGTVEVISDVGVGTAFTLRFPHTSRTSSRSAQ